MPLPRNAAIVLIVTGLCLLALSHYHYGLVAQQGLLIGIVPLLFAGLLLGRSGLWATFGAYFLILLLGAWVDHRNGASNVAMRGEELFNLLQSALGYAIVTLILDRLILKSDVSRQRSRELALLYRQLEAEVEEKERSRAKLIHSQRMDALGKLAGNISHDFNNLLSVILGYASQSDHVADPRTRLDGIAAATRRGKQLTDKLMTLARATPPRLETFDANQVLAELLPMIESMLGKRVRVAATLCPQAAPIHMDLAEFEACVLNIAKNAGDAIAGEGGFGIESRIVDGDFVLRLTDDGCGMSDEVSARVFDPFFTTKPAQQGTGIGLSVVYRTITESGGHIDVDSTPEQGTCFTLRLPLQTTGGNPAG
ncbi:sensor histidine kinase [Luteimonas sp. e5]